jgi:hypothetical protein
MQETPYPYLVDLTRLEFAFTSENEERLVYKRVIFTLLPVSDLIYNLALVDVAENGLVDDHVVSDNGDLIKVLATVFRIILQFLKTHPEAKVYFTGNTPARTRLYRIAMARELNRLDEFIRVYGITGEAIELFRLNRPYEAFLIGLKKKEL